MIHTDPTLTHMHKRIIFAGNLSELSAMLERMREAAPTIERDQTAIILTLDEYRREFPAVQFERLPDEGLLDGSDNTVKASMIDAGLL
jgi:hypothetical protein